MQYEISLVPGSPLFPTLSGSLSPPGEGEEERKENLKTKNLVFQ